MNDCISAISTANGVGGVAIIRISGNKSLEIAEKMFSSKIAVKDFEPYKLYVGTINAGDFTDFGMCVYFKAPKSYTGEDMIEFHCHGGIAISQGILKRTFELGARPATNGEFTKRAFLNGKLSLSSCEGLIDMINGETKTQAKLGFYLYRENLYKKIIVQQDILTNILAQIDVDIDYPEDDVPTADENVVKERIIGVLDQINSLLSTFDSASKAKNGIKVAIVGRPNAGKSSLLNAVIGYEKAIVTDIEGTTRDIVEGTLEINGIKFTFFDTAGIRDSSNAVEKIGIERAIMALEKADIVVHVISADKGFTDEDKEIQAKIADFPHINILNKIDISVDDTFNYDLLISATKGLNIDKFKQMLFEKANIGSVEFNGDFISEERHYYALTDAKNSLVSAINNIGVMPLDIVTVDIREAWHNLGLVSGLTCDQAVIDEIFAKFCVGK